MTFALSGVWIAAGLAGLAGALYLLQRLRVRHREIAVVTTIFWKQAIEETRARVLVQRFRHLPAYLFLLAIASLLWLGFANPRSDDADGTMTVLLLDGSAGMAEGTRFADAKATLIEEARDLPVDRREVLFCGADTRTLLAPGENVLLLEKRLEGLAPQEAPSSLARVARALRGVHGGVVIRVHGDPAAVEAPTAFGVAPSARGAWDRVDLLALPPPDRTRTGGRWPSKGSRFLQAQVNSYDGGSERTGLWQDVPADGDVLRTTYGGRERLLVLPRRTRIRVRLQAALAERMRALLASDPGIELVDAEADVHVQRGSRMAIDRRTPTLAFVTDPLETFGVAAPGGDASAWLEDAAEDLALAEIDGAALADALGRVVSLGTFPSEDGDAGVVAVDAALLDPEIGFVRSRAFALLVAGAIRRLAAVPPFPPFVAAGEPVPAITGPVTVGGQRIDALGVPYTPPVAGPFMQGTQRFEASLQQDPSAVAFAGVETVDASRAWPLVRWIGLLAFVLLLAEWWFVRRGRMP